MTLAFSEALHRLAPVGGPLIGRAAEMDALRRAWADVCEGQGRTVLLCGEGGVGKTRLVAELAGEIDADGAAVAFGSCPATGADPYAPLIEALGTLPTVTGDREAMLRALADAVVARARRVPLLLVLDDLHHAGRSTLLAVRRVVEAVGGSPVLLVGTYRDATVDRAHPLGEFLAAMLCRPRVERIAVDGLSPGGLAEMVGDAELARRLWRQSEGNPLRAAELLRLGTLGGALPPTFDDLVGRRMEALSSSARSFVEAAAVFGSEFRADVVAATAGMSAERATAALRQLVAAGLVVDRHGGSGECRRFAHDMVREAIVRQVGSAARVRLHLRIAQVLDGSDEDIPPAVLAWHFRAAAPVGGSVTALRQSARAGDRAMELLAWEEAEAHYGHALAAASGAGPAVRADLLLSLGEAQRLAGEPARARQAFLEAAAVAGDAHDGTTLARAALALGQVDAVWGDDSRLEDLAGEARSLLGRAGAAAPAVDFASDALYDVLDGVTGDSRAQAAPVVAPTRNPPSDPAAMLRARHAALAGPQHADDRLSTAHEVVAVATASGDDQLAATALGWRLADGLEVGRPPDQVAADRAAHASLARRLGDPRPLADATTWSAMQALLDGRVEEARTAAAAAYEIAVEAGDPEADDSFLLQRWWLALEWGTAGELCDVAQECLARTSGAAGGRTWRAVAALALARAGRLEEAAEELRRVTDHGLGELMRDPGRLHPLSCLAEVAWILGDDHRSATVGPMLDPFADRILVAGRAVLCRGSVARWCGLVAASAHRWDDAERHFQAAIAVHRRFGALPLLARTRFEWSRVLLERSRKGDKRKAAESRRKSAELATRLGMSRLLQEMDPARTPGSAAT